MAKHKKEKKTTEVKKNEDFGHEIWGLLFFALSALIFIALVSHFFNHDNNILGNYIGTALSIGLIYLFGPVCVFLFPAAIGFLGWQRLQGEPVNVRLFFFGTLIMIEMCLLLAIYQLPAIASRLVTPVTSNITGYHLVQLIEPIFGKHTFGPYFITSIFFIVTALLAFRIPPQRIFLLVKSAAVRLARFCKEQWQIRQQRQEEFRKHQAARAEEKRLQKEQKREPEKTAIGKKNQDNVVAKIDPVTTTETSGIDEFINECADRSSDDASDIEDEARRRLEQELAAFRAKRSEPIKIMSIETEDIEGEADRDDVEENDEVLPDDDLFEITGKIPEETHFSTTSMHRVISTKPYVIPDVSVIPDPPPLSGMIDKDAIEQNSLTLEKTLMNFGVEGKVAFVSPGPVVTRYEIELAPGVKVSRVVNLHDDLSMAVGGQRIRIEAPIPGKSAVGIELPNAERQIVHFKHVLLSDTFKKTKAKLPIIIGSNVSGAPYVTDVAKMPHVLIAGQTGSGKSVCINSIICSLLMTMKPEDLRLIMIDPKKVELAFFEGIPHLLSPVVTESKEAVKALQWGVIEMERRYRILAKVGARHIDSFNSKVGSEKFAEILPDGDNKKLPFIVIIVDELADLMMTASKDVEVLIQRIAQLARAVGIHLIVATQRPSVDIITGPIKANLTSRIGFRTIQSTDSRTILGHVGAEKLLGMGDMLFLRNGAPEIERFHGAFISEDDVEKIVASIRDQNIEVEKIESFIEATGGSDNDTDAFISNGERDELFEEAARTIVSIGQGSTSLLQRRMKIGYARAGRLMDELERAGFVGPPDGSKAREVLVKPDEIEELLLRLH